MEGKIQKAIIVDGFESITTLNKWLEKGAKVVETESMPSSVAVSAPAGTPAMRLHHRRSCFVVTEGLAEVYEGIELPYSKENQN